MPGTIVEEEEEGEVWWEAEKVVASRVICGSKEYRVRWVGCSKKDDTWEPEDNLADSLYDLAKQYDDDNRGKRKNSASGSTKAVAKKPRRSATVDAERKPWTVPEGQTLAGGPSLLSLGQLSINTLSHDVNPPLSFASYYFGKRIVTVEVPFKKNVQAPPKEASFGGYTLQLLSSRVPKESKAGKSHFNDSRMLKFTYVATKGPGLPVISLEKKLDAIADFKSLSPHKAKARLELLDSGTNEGLMITDLKLKDFKLVKEEGHLGCGFIGVEMLHRILGYGEREAGPMNAIQIRVISPKLGIFKGVLCPKLGIDCIELPQSMQKVKPSRVRSGQQEWTCLLVKAIFPTSRNIHIGRELDPGAPPPCLSHFRGKDQSPGKMIERLWQSLGIERRKVVEYVKRCNRKGTIAGVKHAYLLGVADPTNELLKGQIFLPGMGKEHGVRPKVFITRSPCVESQDGRLVRVVNSKPKQMKVKNWAFLNRFPFGIVVFGPPIGQTAPLPTLIANGDLDGDTFFVCWDPVIVRNVQSLPRSIAATCKLIPSSTSPRRKGTWLSASQDVMRDVDWFVDIKTLNGRLWGASKKTADESSRFMNDPTAAQLAKAYKLSLDLAKRGGRLSIPSDIRLMLPKSLHRVLHEQDEKGE